MLFPLLSVGAGLVFLAGGADVLVRGATSVARRVGITPLVIGLTVVAMATSLPELLVSLDAAFRGSPGVALGNVVGSNIANIGLILGGAALLGPIGVQAQIIRIDGPILVGCSALMLAIGADGTLSRFDGALLVIGLVTYIVYSIRKSREEPRADLLQKEFEGGLAKQHALWLDLLYLGGGLAALLFGADRLVEGAIEIAGTLGVSDSVVGLTVVAIGTSLPELATSVTAAYRGEGDIAIGNAVGSSIFNLLGILGLTVLVHPLDTSGFRALDGLVMAGFAIALLPLLRSGFSLSRREGAALVTVYVVYLVSVAVM
ncbi:sodium:calcium antiporter [Longibacter salinarum]|uniref:Sodium:calcium antiporter n=1 Tax=Longibacter salinarum TaxID=1850348 RepID=A0A2A8D398_9BACT|nr:calcium/sodium antiporter [Longibacter salinarum]PEN15273.1 sodium:calcium antiporter [Longibacter salinarum]